jgi:hypothetical protein
MARCFLDDAVTMVTIVTMVMMMIGLAREWGGWWASVLTVMEANSISLMRAREGRGWWESVAWGMRVIARDVRVRVVVVGDGEDVGARRRHVRRVPTSDG